jgi:hypothetical protein
MLDHLALRWDSTRPFKQLRSTATQTASSVTAIQSGRPSTTNVAIGFTSAIWC